MPSSTSDLICWRSVMSARVSRAQPSTRRKPGLDVDGLEDLQLLGGAQVGRVPGHVGDPRGPAHVAQCFRHGPGTPAEQDVLQHGPVLTGQLDHGRRLRRFVDVFDLYPQGLAGAGHGTAQQGATLTADGDGGGAAGQFAHVDDLGHHPTEE